MAKSRKNTKSSRKTARAQPKANHELLTGAPPRHTHFVPEEITDPTDTRHADQIPLVIPLPGDDAFAPYVPGLAWNQQPFFLALTNVAFSPVGKTSYGKSNISLARPEFLH